MADAKQHTVWFAASFSLEWLTEWSFVPWWPVSSSSCVICLRQSLCVLFGVRRFLSNQGRTAVLSENAPFLSEPYGHFSDSVFVK